MAWGAREAVCWVAAFAGASMALAQGGPPPAKVVLDPARLESIEQHREVTGEIRAMRRSLVAAEQGGRVKSIGVDAGDPVEPGRVVVVLDTALQEIEVRRLTAVLEARRASARQRQSELERARRELDRMSAASVREAMSKSDVDEWRMQADAGEARLAEADAEIAVAQAALADATTRLQKMSIATPIGGRVVGKRTEVGQWVNAGDPVVEVLDVDSLEGRLDVPAALAGGLVEGRSRLRVRLLPSRVELEGTVTRVVPEADARSRLVPVRVALGAVQASAGAARPIAGMACTAQVPTGLPGQSLTISKDALLRDDAGEFVYANLGGSAMPLRVKRLFMSGERVAIEPGAVAPGMALIVEGNERIMFPGQPVAPMGEQPPAPGGGADPPATGARPASGGAGESGKDGR